MLKKKQFSLSVSNLGGFSRQKRSARPPLFSKGKSPGIEIAVLSLDGSLTEISNVLILQKKFPE